MNKTFNIKPNQTIGLIVLSTLLIMSVYITLVIFTHPFLPNDHPFRIFLFGAHFWIEIIAIVIGVVFTTVTGVAGMILIWESQNI